MYPKLYLEYFREFDRTDEVFVAMPMAATFEPRWRQVYQPAIRAVSLIPVRADTRRVSDSILTDILRGIGRARIIMADVSSEPSGRPNPNVMYELGLAHAMRLPEEVIVVRDGHDAGNPPFDLRHIRWASVDFARPVESRRLIARTLQAALDEVDDTRDLIVGRAKRGLDPEMIAFLKKVGSGMEFSIEGLHESGMFFLDGRETTEQHLRVLARALIARGLFNAGGGAPQYHNEYAVTALGHAVYRTLGQPARRPARRAQASNHALLRARSRVTPRAGRAQAARRAARR